MGSAVGVEELIGRWLMLPAPQRSVADKVGSERQRAAGAKPVSP